MHRSKKWGNPSFGKFSSVSSQRKRRRGTTLPLLSTGRINASYMTSSLVLTRVVFPPLERGQGLVRGSRAAPPASSAQWTVSEWVISVLLPSTLIGAIWRPLLLHSGVNYAHHLPWSESWAQVRALPPYLAPRRRCIDGKLRLDVPPGDSGSNSKVQMYFTSTEKYSMILTLPPQKPPGTEDRTESTSI